MKNNTYIKYVPTCDIQVHCLHQSIRPRGWRRLCARKGRKHSTADTIADYAFMLHTFIYSILSRLLLLHSPSWNRFFLPRDYNIK